MIKTNFPFLPNKQQQVLLGQLRWEGTITINSQINTKINIKTNTKIKINFLIMAIMETKDLMLIKITIKINIRKIGSRLFLSKQDTLVHHFICSCLS